MIVAATALRSVASGRAPARWSLRVVVSTPARIDPSTANPTVEPSARCTLMMPDAIPARAAGTAVIASEVIGVRHNPTPTPTNKRPAPTIMVPARSPAIRTPHPTICDARPRRISRREPITPTSFPAVSDTIIMLALYGNSSNPASVGEKPRTFCRYWVTTSNIPYVANNTAKIVIIAKEYVRSPNSIRSIIGSTLLRSQKINAASAAPATTKSVRISPDSQPAWGPSITANAKAPTAIMNRSCPGMSNLRGRSSRDSTTNPHVRAKMTIPTGTLTIKIEGQPVCCTMKPPSVGPIPMAVLAIAVQIPVSYTHLTLPTSDL